MAMTLEGAFARVEEALDEFDLGVEFVAKEVASATGNEFVAAYVAGMLEEAVMQLLTLTPEEERLAMVGEIQAMALQTAIGLAEEDA